LKPKKQLHREKQIKENIFKKSKTTLRKEKFGNSTEQIRKKNVRKEKREEVHQKDYDENDVADMVQNSSSGSESENGYESCEEAPEIEEMEQHTLFSSGNAPNKKMKDLLPIKTKSGVVPRQQEVSKLLASKVASEQSSDDDKDVGPDDGNISEEDRDSDEDVILEDVSYFLLSYINYNSFETNFFSQTRVVKKTTKNLLSAAELLAERTQEVQKQRFRIGVICSGLLEKPEEKVKNLGLLVNLIYEYGPNKEVHLLSTRKLAMISMAEVFKDIIPEYRVGIVDLHAQKGTNHFNTENS
jgi:nucleolar complex protein 3